MMIKELADAGEDLIEEVELWNNHLLGNGGLACRLLPDLNRNSV